jgi:hypothetical protein
MKAFMEKNVHSNFVRIARMNTFTANKSLLKAVPIALTGIPTLKTLLILQTLKSLTAPPHAQNTLIAQKFLVPPGVICKSVTTTAPILSLAVLNGMTMKVTTKLALALNSTLGLIITNPIMVAMTSAQLPWNAKMFQTAVSKTFRRLFLVPTPANNNIVMILAPNPKFVE